MTGRPIPEDPRVARQRVLAVYVRVWLAVVLVLATVTTFAPDDRVERVGVALVVSLVVAPVGRVLWLMVRWLRRGDRRFALAAVALLLVMGAALVLG